MTARAKFLFDLDFAAAADQRPTLSLAEHEARCAAREAQGYRNGVEAAQAAAQAQARQSIAATLAAIGSTLERIGRDLQALEMRLESEAVEVASAIAMKLAPELIAREPFAEIAALAADCFQHLTAKPHVVIRVSDAAYEDAKRQLEDIARGRGFEGRLVVLAEPPIAAGDCRIEWADGGVIRDRAQIEAAVAEAVARYIAARREHPEHQH